jgi:choloylglycine hydrolase
VRGGAEAALFLWCESEACTRAVYLGPNGTILTGTTMDFSIDNPANL